MATKKTEIMAEPGKTSFNTRRVVEAPRILVFETFTRPEYLKRWMGPRSMTMISCESDLQVGGHYRYVYRDKESKDVGFHGEYREIVHPERVVRTFVYEPMPDKEALETLTLEESGGKTTILTTTEHKTVEDRDGHLHSGVESGMDEVYERLDELLVELQKSTERRVH